MRYFQEFSNSIVSHTESLYNQLLRFLLLSRNISNKQAKDIDISFFQQQWFKWLPCLVSVLTRYINSHLSYIVLYHCYAVTVLSVSLPLTKEGIICQLFNINHSVLSLVTVNN